MASGWSVVVAVGRVRGGELHEQRPQALAAGGQRLRGSLGELYAVPGGRRSQIGPGGRTLTPPRAARRQTGCVILTRYGGIAFPWRMTSKAVWSTLAALTVTAFSLTASSDTPNTAGRRRSISPAA